MSTTSSRLKGAAQRPPSQPPAPSPRGATRYVAPKQRTGSVDKSLGCRDRFSPAEGLPCAPMLCRITDSFRASAMRALPGPEHLAIAKTEICARSWRQAISIGRTINASSGRSPSRTSIRRSKGRPRTVPGRRPNVLSTPRIWLDNRVVMPMSCDRAPNKARAR